MALSIAIYTSMPRTSPLSMYPMHPQKLASDEFAEIHELTQDLWADGSSELLKCMDCSMISGKKDIFWHLPIDIYRQKVSYIIPQVSHMKCTHCSSSNTQLIHHSTSSIPAIQDRLMTNIDAHTVLCRNERWELVWYAESYVAKIEDAHRWELAPHYPHTSYLDIQKRIEKVLSMDISQVIVFSALWLMLEYRSPFIFAELLKTFFATIDFEQSDLPGIMEIWHNNGIYKVFMWLGGISLNASDPSYFARHLVASPRYASTIAVFPRTIPVFRQQFTKNSVREILQVV